MPRARSWTDEELVEAVAASTSWSQVTSALGLVPGGGTYKVIKRHAARLSLDVAHLTTVVAGSPWRRRRFTDDDLRDAVTACTTLAAVLRRLGYQPSGGMHRYVRAKIRELGLDTSHFVGRGWARGRRSANGFKARPLDEVLVDGSFTSGSVLLRRLIAADLKAHRCEQCARTTWEGQPIPLHLDHVNGEPTDNRLENLRALCPNCHAQTPTYCGRNRGRVAKRQTRQA